MEARESIGRRAKQCTKSRTRTTSVNPFVCHPLLLALQTAHDLIQRHELEEIEEFDAGYPVEAPLRVGTFFSADSPVTKPNGAKGTTAYRGTYLALVISLFSWREAGLVVVPTFCFPGDVRTIPSKRTKKGLVTGTFDYRPLFSCLFFDADTKEQVDARFEDVSICSMRFLGLYNPPPEAEQHRGLTFWHRICANSGYESAVSALSPFLLPAMHRAGGGVTKRPVGRSKSAARFELPDELACKLPMFFTSEAGYQAAVRVAATLTVGVRSCVLHETGMQWLRSVFADARGFFEKRAFSKKHYKPMPKKRVISQPLLAPFEGDVAEEGIAFNVPPMASNVQVIVLAIGRVPPNDKNAHVRSDIWRNGNGPEIEFRPYEVASALAVDAGMSSANIEQEKLVREELDVIRAEFPSDGPAEPFFVAEIQAKSSPLPEEEEEEEEMDEAAFFEQAPDLGSPSEPPVSRYLKTPPFEPRTPDMPPPPHEEKEEESEEEEEGAIQFVVTAPEPEPSNLHERLAVVQEEEEEKEEKMDEGRLQMPAPRRAPPAPGKRLTAEEKTWLDNLAGYEGFDYTADDPALSMPYGLVFDMDTMDWGIPAEQDVVFPALREYIDTHPGTVPDIPAALRDQISGMPAEEAIVVERRVEEARRAPGVSGTEHIWWTRVRREVRRARNKRAGSIGLPPDELVAPGIFDVFATELPPTIKRRRYLMPPGLEIHSE